MLEIEIKILNQKHKDLEPKLLKLGAKKIFEGLLEATIYDDINHSIKNSKNTLRLRKEGDTTVLCFKEFVPNETLKIAKETEIEVSDINKTKEILNKLGFFEQITSKKYRVSYEFEDVKVEFDKYLGDLDIIPEFLEIESESEEKINQMITLLGFTKKDTTKMNAKELIEFYKKK
jgi:adenylate cyclase, class 2